MHAAHKECIQSTMANSGLMLAAWMRGLMIMGRYWTTADPIILHILAHALSMYEAYVQERRRQSEGEITDQRKQWGY